MITITQLAKPAAGSRCGAATSFCLLHRTGRRFRRRSWAKQGKVPASSEGGEFFEMVNYAHDQHLGIGSPFLSENNICQVTVKCTSIQELIPQIHASGRLFGELV